MNSPKKELLLSKTKSSWMVTWLGPEQDSIIGLFGTNILPTAFTSNAAWQTVATELRRLNPDYEVS